MKKNKAKRETNKEIISKESNTKKGSNNKN